MFGSANLGPFARNQYDNLPITVMVKIETGSRWHSYVSFCKPEVVIFQRRIEICQIRPYHRNRHVILHQPAKFHRNRPPPATKLWRRIDFFQKSNGHNFTSSQTRARAPQSCDFHSRASKLQAASADQPVSVRQGASVPIKLLHPSQSSSFAARYQLTVPRHRLSTYGRRAFAVAGPTMFNTLPDDLRDPAVSTSTFRQSLKTHLLSAYQHI